jgi:hypothetical protein
MLTTYSSFLSRIDELGFMTLSPVLAGLPSLSGETRESQWHTGDRETDPWRWKDRAAEEKQAAYGCVLGGHKGFVAARLYATFYSACRPAQDIEERWANGHVKATTREVYRLFEKKAPLDTSGVRRELGVSAKSGAGRVDADTRVTPADSTAAPAVRARFWSKSLNELATVRKVQMVMEGMTSGRVILRRICRELAPSIRAASNSSGGMPRMPAT